jgi:hypothetical protein
MNNLTSIQFFTKMLHYGENQLFLEWDFFGTEEISGFQSFKGQNTTFLATPLIKDVCKIETRFPSNSNVSLKHPLCDVMN